MSAFHGRPRNILAHHASQHLAFQFIRHQEVDGSVKAAFRTLNLDGWHAGVEYVCVFRNVLPADYSNSLFTCFHVFVEEHAFLPFSLLEVYLFDPTGLALELQNRTERSIRSHHVPAAVAEVDSENCEHFVFCLPLVGISSNLEHSIMTIYKSKLPQLSIGDS